MTFDVTIRHSKRMGTEISRDHREIEAKDEQDLLEHMRFEGVFDGVSEIRPLEGSSVMEFSVDTGHTEFPTHYEMPKDVHKNWAISDYEAREG